MELRWIVKRCASMLATIIWLAGPVVMLVIAVRVAGPRALPYAAGLLIIFYVAVWVRSGRRLKL